MCYPRKTWLGKYNASRSQWIDAYRAARCLVKAGGEPNPSLSGIEWKAQLIVAFDRTRVDPLATPVSSRLAANKIIQEIVEELEHD